MIQSKSDLKEYLEADQRQLGITRSCLRPFTDETWRYEIMLRKHEYLLNRSGIIAKIMKTYFKLKYHRNSIRGNNVYLGSGCKMIGAVKIADNCAVGANVFVTKDIFS